MMSRPVAFVRRHRRITIALVGLLVLLGGLLIWIDSEHHYDIETSEVAFTYRGERIVGTLATPRGPGLHGLVVFIHGDGPANADRDGGYRPIWESFARAGYASFSWDKPGVGRSEGNWLDYSMSDRADLASAAIDALATQDEIDPSRIGLWGISQAGSVMPKIVRRRSDIRFVIAVSTAINWRDQARFNLLAELKHEGANPAETAQAIKYLDALWALLDREGSYDEYRALARTAPKQRKTMSRARWHFASINFRSDARRDLAALKNTPVLLQLAGKDRNVDVAETAAVYRQILGDDVEIRRYPDALHSMARADLETGVKGWLTAIFAPRSVFAEHFLDEAEAFLTRQR